MEWHKCIVQLPHIVANPCHPRWVVRCSHGEWFWHSTKTWIDKRDEREAWLALWGLYAKLTDHCDQILEGV